MILRRLILASFVLISYLGCAHEPVPSEASYPVPTPQACKEMIARGGRC